MVAQQFGSYPKQDLKIEDLENFLDCQAGQNLEHLQLEGNHGDPIYYSDLFKLIETFRSKKFTLVTNGSYQTETFWRGLAERLTDQDWVIFSVDGLEHNNHLYRRNSDWASTMMGIDIISKSAANLGWKTIIFDYNYKELDQIQKLAESKGAEFVAQHTSRFGDPALKPPDHLVDQTREYTDQTNQIEKIQPQCENWAKEYVSADGYYWPCCWISTAFTLPKSKIWQQRSDWKIQGQTLDQMRARLNTWTEEIKTHPKNSDVVCKMMCKSGNTPLLNHGLTTNSI
jgi:MoaA/NifB/PqqE/SkfB family radical SAM enzyme